MWPRLFILCILLILPSENLIYSSKERWTIRFCPEQDCEDLLIGLINNASTSMDCAFYTIDRPSVISAIQNRTSDIGVRIVMDSRAKSRFNNATSVLKSQGHGLMHNKFCIIDEKTLMTGSFNPTKRSKLDFNNIFVIESEDVASNYAAEFDELWMGEFAKGRPTVKPVIDDNNMIIETYFCPEDGCLSRLRKIIGSARTEIYFMLYDFTLGELGNDLILKHYNGIQIRGIMESSKATSRKIFDMLAYQEIDVRRETTNPLLHHKVFIIDNETVVTGSFNPSFNANKRNDENIMVIHSRDAARIFLNEFDRIWDTAD